VSESNDGSRIEAAEAGVHTEVEEVHEHGGAHPHVTATDSVPHDDHDDHGGGHGGGHGADPNAGVLRGDPPTPAWVGAATVICLVTALACVWLAIKIG
jgi:hypothetical protein